MRARKLLSKCPLRSLKKSQVDLAKMTFELVRKLVNFRTEYTARMRTWHWWFYWSIYETISRQSPRNTGLLHEKKPSYSGKNVRVRQFKVDLCDNQLHIKCNGWSYKRSLVSVTFEFFQTCYFCTQSWLNYPWTRFTALCAVNIKRGSLADSTFPPPPSQPKPGGHVGDLASPPINKSSVLPN